MRKGLDHATQVRRKLETLDTGGIYQDKGKDNKRDSSRAATKTTRGTALAMCHVNRSCWPLVDHILPSPALIESTPGSQPLLPLSPEAGSESLLGLRQGCLVQKRRLALGTDRPLDRHFSQLGLRCYGPCTSISLSSNPQHSPAQLSAVV